LNVVFLHALGDVPSPILVGLLKDSLAPGCNSADDDQATDDGNIAASDSCRHDAHGLRVTMLITTLWLTWTSFFFFLAYFLNKMHFLVLPDCCCVCCDDGTELPEEEEHEPTSSRGRQGQKNAHYISPALQGSPTRQPTNESSKSAVNPMQAHAESAFETNHKVKTAGDLVSEVWNQEQHLDRVRILSADEYKVADSEEQRRSVERLKRFSREGSIDGSSSSSPFSAVGRLSGGSGSGSGSGTGTTSRRSKSGVSTTSSAAASLSTNGGGAGSAEPLYNRFREIEDTINI
jgi:hypothetical protein